MSRSLYCIMTCVFVACTVFSINGFSLSLEERQKAVKLVKSGNQLYEHAEYEDALIAYERAYDIVEDPDILYRIAQIYEQIEQYESAVLYLEQFLVRRPQSPYATRIRAKISRLQEQYEPVSATLRVRTDVEGAQISILGDDARQLGTTPLEVMLEAGTYQLSVLFANGEVVEESIRLEVGETLALNLSQPAPQIDVALAQPPEQHAPLQPPASEIEFHYVDIGPPTIVIGLSWMGIIVGQMLILTGYIGGDAGMPLLWSGFFMASGAALFSTGSYALVFHNWARHLAPVERPTLMDDSADMVLRSGLMWRWQF